MSCFYLPETFVLPGAENALPSGEASSNKYYSAIDSAQIRYRGRFIGLSILLYAVVSLALRLHKCNWDLATLKCHLSQSTRGRSQGFSLPLVGIIATSGVCLAELAARPPSAVVSPARKPLP